MNSLRIIYTPEDEWYGEIRAAVVSGAFTGEGSAWLGVDNVREFSRRLGAYPLREDELPALEGGFWNSTKSETLEQTHLAIRIAPHDAKGALRVFVLLGTEVWNSANA